MLIAALLGCPADPATSTPTGMVDTDSPSPVVDTDTPTAVVPECQPAELGYGAGCTESRSQVTDLFGPGPTPGDPIYYAPQSSRFDACGSDLTLTEGCEALFGTSVCPRIDDPVFDAPGEFGDWSPAEPDPLGRDLMVRWGAWGMLVTAPPPFPPVPAPARVYFEPGGDMVLLFLSSLDNPLFCCNGEGWVDYLLIGDVIGTDSCLLHGEE